MTEYAWVITCDHIADPEAKPGSYSNAIGLRGPRGCDKTAEEIKTSGAEFRMYDDDKVLYYSGFYLGPDDENMFAPLEDFGMPNAGAVRIDYRNPDGSFSPL